MVTNPATRDWTVTASLFATLNEMYGNRTVCGIGRGDSAVRVTNGKPDDAGDAARGDRTSSASCQRPRGRATTARRSAVPVGARRARSRSGWPPTGRRRCKLAGEVGDGFILQLADPDIARWMITAVREAAAAAGRDPDVAHVLRGRAGVRRRATSPHLRDQCRWFGGMVGNHVADIVARYGADPASGAPRRSPTTSRAARATTTTSTARPATPHTDFVPDEIVDRFCLLGPARAAHRPARGAARASASTSSPSTCSTTTRTQTLEAYGETIIPALRGPAVAMS